MLITKVVIVKWHSSNKKWYESKGYIFTKWKDEFEVNVEDLSDGSTALVDIQCDNCGEMLRNIKWKDYLKHRYENNKYYCHKCVMQLFGGEKMRKTSLINSVSFYQWCYDNLLKELADYILSRWDYDLNVDKNGKVLSPKDISFCSSGVNKKGYWFKCLDHPEHGSELKSINSFINGNGNIYCHQCNTIAITHPHLIKYLINKEDAYKYSFGSHYYIPMKCPDCGYEKPMKLNVISRQGFGNICCNDGISFPEKFIFNMLDQLLNKNFTLQLSKKDFIWCENYRYDFHIDKINCIIETHGLQHYEEVNTWKLSLEEIKEKDLDKEWLAKTNKIENYIIIDCRESTMEWIKKSVITSKLPNLLGFKESDIDWLKCHEYACNNLVKEVCDLWANGNSNILNIANKFKIHRITAINYLKKGVKIGWCDYNPKKEIEKVVKQLQEKSKIKVICLSTDKVFNSIMEASKEYNINNTGIGRCCKDKQKTAGKHPITKEKLRWMFYSEYINNKGEIQK